MSALSPYLFEVIDVLNESIQEMVPQYTLVTDDIILVEEPTEEIDENLQLPTK